MLAAAYHGSPNEQQYGALDWSKPGRRDTNYVIPKAAGMRAVRGRDLRLFDNAADVMEEGGSVARGGKADGDRERSQRA